MGFSRVAVSGGHSHVGVSRLLIAVAPRVEEHGLQSVGFSGCGPWALGHRLASCASRAYWLCSMWDLPSPGIEPVSPASAGGVFPTEPPGKPKRTGMCSLLLLQGNFLTQESNWGLLHCRQILYQLSNQGSPKNHW